MPTIQVPPKVFMTHHGVDVYHTYKHEESNVEDTMTNYFSFYDDESHEDYQERIFDVRNLSLYDPEKSSMDDLVKLIGAVSYTHLTLPTNREV